MFRPSVVGGWSALFASSVRGLVAVAAARRRSAARWLAAPVLVWCLLAGAGVGRAQTDTPDTNWWVPGGPVYAVTVTDSTVYLGGDFNRVGPNTGQGVPLDLSSAQPWADYPRVAGEVPACVADGAGGWYIGGEFTAVGGVTRNHLAHILADGTLDPAWSPDCDGAVYALAIAGSTVYAGGYFTTVNGGTARRHLAAFNTTDGTATAWNPDCNDAVCALAVTDDGSTVYAGGYFTTVNGGTVRSHLAAFNTTDGTATAWNPECNGYVYALAVANGTVYAGGQFLAAFNTTDGTATAWNPECNGYVYALAIAGSTIYAGGLFTTVNGGTVRNYLAAFNTSDGTATGWSPDCNSEVFALAVDGGTVYAGGYFTTVNGGTARNYLAAFNATNGTATAWNPDCGGELRVGGRVSALAVSGSAVYAGGDFATIGGVVRNGLAALDRTTGQITPWNPDCNDWACALAVSADGGTVYAGGGFTTVNGGTVCNYLAAFNTTDGTATVWNPDCNDTVGALAVTDDGSTVYAGGQFTTVNGGTVRNHLAAFNTTAGTATAWNPDCNEGVYALAVAGGTVYAGGWFTTVNGGTVRNHLAAFNTTDGTATAWNPDCNDWVRALAVAGGTVYAGGWFSTVNGRTKRNGLAAFNTADGTVTRWNPNCYYWVVNALAVASGTVYAGGGFWEVNGGTLRNGLAAFNTTDGTATAWNPDCDVVVHALAVANGVVYVGGSFFSVGNAPCPYFAVFAHRPLVNPNSYSTAPNTPLNVPAPGVLANDTDANGDPLTAVKLSDPAHGTVTLNADGSFTYTPAAGYGGTDSFTYKANDGTSDSGPGTVTIAVKKKKAVYVASSGGGGGCALSGRATGATLGGWWLLSCGLVLLGTAGLRWLAGPAIALCLLAGAGVGRAQTDTPDTTWWVPNGPVNAVAVTDSTVYLGGAFTRVGRNTGQGVPLDLSSAQPWAAYPHVAGPVNACVADGAGGWYIGGSFTAVGGVTRNGLAHILADGTLDPVWNPDCNGGVCTLAVSADNTMVCVGGWFHTVNGDTTRNNLAAFNTSDGTATAWNPDCDWTVCALAVANDTIYAGGGFTTVNGGTARNRLAAFNTTDGTATAWNPDCDNWVFALAVADSTVYVGGDFTTVNGATTRNWLAAFNTTDGTATAWNPDCGGYLSYVAALAVAGNTVYVGGDFTTVNGSTARHGLAAFNTGDGTATAWNPDCGGGDNMPKVNTLAVSADGSTVYAGGFFTMVNGGTPRNRLAAFNATDGKATAWSPEVDSGASPVPWVYVCALAISGSAIYAGGDFTSFGGVVRNRLAALDRVTGQPTAWNPDCDGEVCALAVAGSTVYAGGYFATVNGGTTRNRLAAFNATDGGVTAWNPNCNYRVYALAVGNGVIYVGGWFWAVNGGTARNNIAAFNMTDGTATAWNPNCNGQVYALAVAPDGSTVYAGGQSFSLVNGDIERNGLAAFNTTDGTATAWNPNCNGYVSALAVAGSTVYAGGWFDRVNGSTERWCLAAFGATTGKATRWNPNCWGDVLALVAGNGVVFAGGGFTAVNGGTPRNCVAAFNTTDGTATAWNPNCDTSALALAVANGTVFAGGEFTFVGKTSCPNFAVFPSDHRPVSNADSYSTKRNALLNVPAPGVLGNDSDANGDPLTAIKVSDPAHGTVTLNADGSFTYTPAADYVGTDSFTYKANDGTWDSGPGTVTITVKKKKTIYAASSGGGSGCALSGRDTGATLGGWWLLPFGLVLLGTVGLRRRRLATAG